MKPSNAASSHTPCPYPDWKDDVTGEPICAGDCACPSCGGDGHDNWFDRSLCPEPCDSMHTRCSNCGASLDPCPFEESTSVAS